MAGLCLLQSIAQTHSGAHQTIHLLAGLWLVVRCGGGGGGHKIGGTKFFGSPIVRTIGYWGLYWGPPIWGNYHVRLLWPKLVQEFERHCRLPM